MLFLKDLIKFIKKLFKYNYINFSKDIKLLKVLKSYLKEKAYKV
jgi:hypothetical protein